MLQPSTTTISMMVHKEDCKTRPDNSRSYKIKLKFHIISLLKAICEIWLFVCTCVVGIYWHCIVKNTAKDAYCYTQALPDKPHPTVLFAQSKVCTADNTWQVVTDHWRISKARCMVFIVSNLHMFAMNSN